MAQVSLEVILAIRQNFDLSPNFHLGFENDVLSFANEVQGGLPPRATFPIRDDRLS